ncbi:hypothetical protein TNCV_4533691 [Trichonephila clavipes]|nr:hypothetical protein TNCV_4533691 [Trichonephila clavipes]
MVLKFRFNIETADYHIRGGEAEDSDSNLFYRDMQSLPLERLHTFRSCQDYFRANYTFYWPAKSLDLSPIEYVLEMVDQ